MIHIWAVPSPRTFLDKVCYRERNKQFLLQNCIFHFRLSNYDKLQRHLKNPLLIKKVVFQTFFFRKYFSLQRNYSYSESAKLKIYFRYNQWLGQVATASPLVKQFSVVPFHHSCFSWLFKFLLSLHCSYPRKALISAAPPSTILSHTRWFCNNSPVIKASHWSICKLYNQAGILVPWCYSCIYSYYLHSALVKVISLIQASKGLLHMTLYYSR